MEVIYEDNHIIVVNKTSSEIVQGDKTGDTPLSEMVKQYLKEKYNKPGNVFIGVTHRLDRPVSGLVVFAKTSKALPSPSITNKSLMQLAEDMGMKVERRPVPEEELLTFEEAGACGTAAVISPIERIDDVENGKSYVIAKDGKPGPVCTKLYNKLRAIQYGDEPDTHGWVTVVE